MFNEFYTCLLNRRAVDNTATVGKDWIHQDFNPAKRHPIVETLSNLFLGTDVQAMNYWICRVRQAMSLSPLQRYYTAKQRQGGYALASVAAAIQDSLQPRLVRDQYQCFSTGPYYAENYRLHRFSLQRVSLEGDTPGVQVLRNKIVVGNYVVVDGQVKLPLFTDADVSCSIPYERIPDTLLWAATPEKTLGQRHRDLVGTLTPLLQQVGALPTILAKTQVSALVNTASSPLAGEQGAIALCILIASHTKKMLA